MPEENRVAAQIVGEDGNRQRFHQGKHPQGGIPADLTEEEQATLDLHMASIHAPEARPQPVTDEDGEPVGVTEAGLIVTDPLTGAVEPLTEESLSRAEENQQRRADQAEARWNAGAAGAAPPPLPASDGKRERPARPSPKEPAPTEGAAPPPPPATPPPSRTA